MLRNDLKRIVGELAEKGTINFKLMDCYNFIDEYCKKHKCNPTKNTYEVINRHLFINNEQIGRVDDYIKPFDNVVGYEDSSLGNLTWEESSLLEGRCINDLEP